MVRGRGPHRFVTDESGASMIETLVVINILIVLVAGFIEFGVAMNQWSLAAKATQVGARLAAVSDPVDSSLSSWTGLGDPTTNPPTGPFPGDAVADNYSILCRGALGTCVNEGGAYSRTPAFDAAAMARLINGSSGDCNATGTFLGMCDVLPRITAANVDVRYQFTGLGYAGRPGGPIPTITVSLTGLTFDFLLLGRLLGLNNLNIPAYTATVVGEDLSKTWSP